MAPRTAKAKKAADVKVSEPKKGRGKAKNAPEPDQDIDEVEEKVVVAEKKNKRGKNIVNYNEDKDEDAPPKKGRKKNVDTKVIDEPVPDEVTSVNGDDSAEEGTTTPADEIDNEETESNGHSEEKAPAKGRKKAVPKKEVVEKEVKTGRGRKNAKQDVDAGDKDEAVEEKPKGRGRGRKPQAKPEPESEENPEEEETKAPPAAKGRKKAQPKPVPEKEADEESENLSTENKDEEDIKPEEPKKRGRKNAPKKAQPEEEPEEVDEDMKEEAPASKKRKGSKKEEKGKGDTKEDEEEDDEDSPLEAKPTKGKRGPKKAADKPANTEEVQDTGEAATKRRRKADEKVADDNKKKAPKNVTDYESLDFSNNSKNSQDKEFNLKISSWNVDGIRAWMSKGGLDYLKYEKPNILCLQETKCSQEKLPDEIKNVPGYHAYWLGSDKDGYAGVCIYTTKLAMNVQYGLQNEELDTEGRIITAEYEQFYLICTYVPNAGRKLVTLDKRLKWNEEFRKYVKALDAKKPVIICGDMNVAHNEIDLTNPKSNKRNAGFTEEERAGMTELLGDGFVDTFRHLYPDKTGAYTFWSNMFNSRAKNVGWRLDYFIISERLVPALCDSVIRDKVYGSDHCPLTLFLRLSSADKPKE
ncbi:DNA-(apurinic or apyrimidinic site) endonuclease [Maniola jurtina]|uniref:DNA-(apurinic or apyrimidinic site) endonuclease n=1 Tax=Maniola jurtina TaxID=191418 RepID=UPI001E68AD44|nr:DNA-(apurinic or apyrimidinic site) endonuclease [Maniola jurtina]